MGRIEEELKVCGAATKGPWRSEHEYISAGPEGLRQSRPNGEIIGRMQPSIDDLLTRKEKRANAAFVAAARTGYPEALLALLKIDATLSTWSHAISMTNLPGVTAMYRDIGLILKAFESKE